MKIIIKRDDKKMLKVKLFTRIKTLFSRNKPNITPVRPEKTTMSNNLIKRILRKLDQDGQYGIGIYKRAYPDNLRSTTMGVLLIELSEYEYFDSNEYAYATFEINSHENGFSPNNPDFYKSFDTRQEVIEYIKIFLKQFKNLKQLRTHVINKFGFINPKNDWRVEAYYTLKSELEDDCNTFEKFSEMYIENRF